MPSSAYFIKLTFVITSISFVALPHFEGYTITFQSLTSIIDVRTKQWRLFGFLFSLIITVSGLSYTGWWLLSAAFHNLTDNYCQWCFNVQHNLNITTWLWTPQHVCGLFWEQTGPSQYFFRWPFLWYTKYLSLFSHIIHSSTRTIYIHSDHVLDYPSTFF